MQYGFTNDMHTFACITLRSISFWELSLFRTLVSKLMGCNQHAWKEGIESNPLIPFASE